MGRARAILLAAVFAFMASAAAASSTELVVPIARVSGAVLAAPGLWFLGVLGLPLERTHAIAAGDPVLRREQGWCEVAIPVYARGRGVCLVVDGRITFDEAVVVLDGVPRRRVDLRGVSRGKGLYELLELAQDEAIESVWVRVRANSDIARLGARVIGVD